MAVELLPKLAFFALWDLPDDADLADEDASKDLV